MAASILITAITSFDLHFSIDHWHWTASKYRQAFSSENIYSLRVIIKRRCILSPVILSMDSQICFDDMLQYCLYFLWIFSLLSKSKYCFYCPQYWWLWNHKLIPAGKGKNQFSPMEYHGVYQPHSRVDSMARSSWPIQNGLHIYLWLSERGILFCFVWRFFACLFGWLAWFGFALLFVIITICVVLCYFMGKENTMLFG